MEIEQKYGKIYSCMKNCFEEHLIIILSKPIDYEPIINWLKHKIINGEFGKINNCMEIPTQILLIVWIIYQLITIK